MDHALTSLKNISGCKTDKIAGVLWAQFPAVQAQTIPFLKNSNKEFVSHFSLSSKFLQPTSWIHT